MSSESEELFVVAGVPITRNDRFGMQLAHHGWSLTKAVEEDVFEDESQTGPRYEYARDSSRLFVAKFWSGWYAGYMKHVNWADSDAMTNPVFSTAMDAYNALMHMTVYGKWVLDLVSHAGAE